MTRRNLSLVLAATIYLIAAPASAQQTPTIQTAQQPGAYSLQVNSQIVVLDVVVNNKKGDPVSSLTRDDFKVYENKVPQTILSFESAIKSAANSAAPDSTRRGSSERRSRTAACPAAGSSGNIPAK